MKRTKGYLHWIFFTNLVIGALAVLFSGRDLTQSFVSLGSVEYIPHPVFTLLQRGVSLLLLAIVAERFINHLALRKHVPSVLLLSVFVAYWVGSIALPAVLGSHPQLSHEYLYPLAVGIAALLARPDEADKVLDASRNALLMVMAAGVLLIPLLPTLVLDSSYTQGLIPELPRLGGLSPHPVALGMLALTCVLLLWQRPLASAWLNRFAWMLSLAVLFLAQSKTSWFSFVLCGACMLVVRQGAKAWRRMSDPGQSDFGVLVCLAVIVAVMGLLGWILLGDVAAQLAGFTDSSEGAQLMSMTGRDRIWAVAMEEWQSNKVFGYGLGLWDAAFRNSIGMPNATNAHNQLMDTLARSGSVGGAVLVVYAAVLAGLSVFYARATGGLSLALFLALALRSVSEVPLTLLSYGTDQLPHLLLLVTLASCASVRRAQSAAQYGALLKVAL